MEVKDSAEIPQEESNASSVLKDHKPKSHKNNVTIEDVAEDNESASGEEVADAAGGEPCSPTAEEAAQKIGLPPKKKKKKARKSKSKRAVSTLLLLLPK